VEIVNGLVVSEGTAELDALIASYLRDMTVMLGTASKVRAWMITI
jgi:hypothetical protein